MSGWIYNLFWARLTPAGYALSESERNQMVATVVQSSKDVGTVPIVACNCTWSSEHWNYFGLERFPSVEALMEHKQSIFNLGWMNILDSHVLLGSSDELAEPAEPQQGGAMPIYKLWMVGLTAAGYAVTPEQQQAGMDRNANYMKEVGGKTLAFCNCFSDEQYQYFGLEQFPNLNAVQEYNRCLRESNFYSYVNSRVLLGTRMAEL